MLRLVSKEDAGYIVEEGSVEEGSSREESGALEDAPASSTSSSPGNRSSPCSPNYPPPDVSGDVSDFPMNDNLVKVREISFSAHSLPGSNSSNLPLNSPESHMEAFGSIDEPVENIFTQANLPGTSSDL